MVFDNHCLKIFILYIAPGEYFVNRVFAGSVCTGYHGRAGNRACRQILAADVC
jgi:hypothetical protein